MIYTTDHGELQGDFGFIYKGPFHVDALVRLPLIGARAVGGRRWPRSLSRSDGSTWRRPSAPS